MSNRKRLRPSNPASEAIRAQDGAQIPGGCDHCDAYQIVRADAYGADMHSIGIYHDDWCPVLASKRSGGAA